MKTVSQQDRSLVRYHISALCLLDKENVVCPRILFLLGMLGSKQSESRTGNCGLNALYTSRMQNMVCSCFLGNAQSPWGEWTVVSFPWRNPKSQDFSYLCWLFYWRRKENLSIGLFSIGLPIPTPFQVSYYTSPQITSPCPESLHWWLELLTSHRWRPSSIGVSSSNCAVNMFYEPFMIRNISAGAQCQCYGPLGLGPQSGHACIFKEASWKAIISTWTEKQLTNV